MSTMNRHKEIFEQVKRSLNERFGQTSYNFVDLGLPSGNLWMDRNLGAVDDSDYGDRYMWGETKMVGDERESNNYSDYFDTKDRGKSYTKYSNPHGLNRLDLSDDVAYIVVGETEYGIARIPSVLDFKELENLKYEWVENYGEISSDGLLFYGTNGNTLFLPASGYQHQNRITSLDSTGLYWTSDLSSERNDSAYRFEVSNIMTGVTDGPQPLTFSDSFTQRTFGCSIRPVITF